MKIQFLVRKNCAIDEKKVHIRLEKYTFLIKEECTSVHKKSTLFQKEMLKPFGLSIFFYRTKTILSTKNIRKYTHEYATSISQNTHICSAKYSHSTTKYIATNLQQHNIQKTKTILLQCKNHTFARQKGGFYTPKKPFLFFVSITNMLLMCYEYSVKWLRTFHNNATHTLLFWGKYKKGPHKWNPFNCKPAAITIANRLQQCHKHPRSIVFLQNTRASGALWF